MIVCCQCRVEMRCDKNGVGADFGHGHVYAGDRYKCPRCGAMVLRTNSSSISDPDHQSQDEYLEMASK